MTVSPLDSALLGPLLSDAETAELFSDEAAVRAMLDFEVALAVAEERCGVIPAGTAEAIASAAAALDPDWKLLGAGSDASGHPVAELVRQLRCAAGPAGDYVHWGATAQDVVDTALVMRLAELLNQFDLRLKRLVGALAQQADSHRRTVMAGRTRNQQAVPITFGLKIAGWLLPLVRHRQRLIELRPRTLTVQLGGAAGTLGVLEQRGLAVMEELARGLGLGAPAGPWHTQRDGLAELAGWLSLVTGSLAKMGMDLSLLAQTEINEATDGSIGSSSAMPHKTNPVRSEALIAAGRANASLLASMHQAAIQEHERSGSAWILEWLTLPQMATLAAASLRLAQQIVDALKADPARMLRNIESSGGAVVAEAAAALLAQAMPVAESRRLVENASRRSRDSGTGLIEILERETHADVAWERLRDPANWLGSNDALIDRAIELAAAAPH